jgi:hypothetical protein
MEQEKYQNAFESQGQKLRITENRAVYTFKNSWTITDGGTRTHNLCLD